MSSKELPVYSKGEEIFNGVSHIVGGALGIIVLILTIILSSSRLDGLSIAACAIYGASLIILYTMSSIYHMLHVNKAKRVFRILDHCTVYLLIAGTYTPIIAIGMRDTQGLILFLIVWCSAILGIVLNAINMHSKVVKIISMILYILVGWAIIFFVKHFIDCVSLEVFIFLLAGGIAYTVGSIFYSIGAHKKWYHSIFHLFCLAGSILQFVSVLLMILR